MENTQGAGIRKSQATAIAAALVLLNACGEPMFENAGSRNSLLDNRKACAAKISESPAATAHRQNPMAHPDYVSQVFADMNRCIEGKGWKQVRSPQEEERLKGAITSEVTHAHTPCRSLSLNNRDILLFEGRPGPSLYEVRATSGQFV